MTIRSFWDRFVGTARAWRKDTSGSIALVFVFCIPVFMLAAGVAVDLAQAYNVKTRLSNALDKAALAAGSSSGTDEEIEDRIHRFFDANYPPEALGRPHDINVLLVSGTVDVTASSTIDTVFMRIFGIDTLDVTVETIVKREVAGLELVLVMDNTGSMADPAGGGISKIEASKTAANTLLDILFGSNSAVPTLFVGVVPFSQDVNIGTSHSSWVSTVGNNWGTTSWYGCVEARETSGRDITDDPPSTALFPKYYSPCSTSEYSDLSTSPGPRNTWYETVGSTVSSYGDFSSSSGWTANGSWSIGSGVASKGGSSDIVANGTFSTLSNWSTGSGWNISGGVLTSNPVDIVTNGGFGSTSNWSLGSRWTISSGTLHDNGSSVSSSAAQTPSTSLVNGDQYLFSYTLNRTSGSVKERLGNGSYSSSHSSSGTISDTVTASSSTDIEIVGSSFKGSVDDVSVIDQTASTYETPTYALFPGDQYQVTFTITNRTAGSVRANIGGNTGTTRSSTGTFTETITAGSGSTIGFDSVGGFAGSIDNFTVVDLTNSGTLTRTSSPSLSTSYSYLVTYDIVTHTAGSVYSMVGNRTGTSNSTPGTYQDVIKPSSTNGNLIGIGTSDGFMGTIDNFTVQQLSSCGAGPTYHYETPLDTTFGPNNYCVQPLIGMTTDKAALESTISSMTPHGSTMIDLGMAWGWRMLSPSWRGLWGGDMDTHNLPLDYNSPNMNKVVILMTDGDNSFGSNDYTAYGDLSNGRLGTTSSSTANSTLNSRTASVCTSMKSHNILIYTIALGTDLNTTSKNMLKACATGPAYYFQSPTTSDLQSAFTAIANQLNSLYITH